MFFACRQRARPAWNREEAAHPGLTSELSGAAGKRQLRSQNVTPRPLERRVGRRTRNEWPLLFAFRTCFLTIRRNTRSTAIAHTAFFFILVLLSSI